MTVAIVYVLFATDLLYQRIDEPISECTFLQYFFFTLSFAHSLSVSEFHNQIQ